MSAVSKVKKNVRDDTTKKKRFLFVEKHGERRYLFLGLRPPSDIIINIEQTRRGKSTATRLNPFFFFFSSLSPVVCFVFHAFATTFSFRWQFFYRRRSFTEAERARIRKSFEVEVRAQKRFVKPSRNFSRRAPISDVLSDLS